MLFHATYIVTRLSIQPILILTGRPSAWTMSARLTPNWRTQYSVASSPCQRLCCKRCWVEWQGRGRESPGEGTSERRPCKVECERVCGGVWMCGVCVCMSVHVWACEHMNMSWLLAYLCVWVCGCKYYNNMRTGMKIGKWLTKTSVRMLVVAS